MLDALIIYLALGAPFGVYNFVSLEVGPGAKRLSRSLAAFILWPISAAFVLYNLLNRTRSEIYFDERSSADSFLIEEARSLYERLRRDALSTGKKNEQRFVGSLDRYLATADIPSSSGKTRSSNIGGHFAEFLVAAGHPNIPLGRECLSRRNLAKRNRHHMDARSELIELASDTDLVGTDLLVGTKTVAELLNDIELATSLAELDNVRCSNIAVMNQRNGNVANHDIQAC